MLLVKKILGKHRNYLLIKHAPLDGNNKSIEFIENYAIARADMLVKREGGNNGIENSFILTRLTRLA